MTRREELTAELQELDRQIYNLWDQRNALQREYDETPETQLAINHRDPDQFKDFNASLERKGWLPPSNDKEAAQAWRDEHMPGGIAAPMFYDR